MFNKSITKNIQKRKCQLCLWRPTTCHNNHQSVLFCNGKNCPLNTKQKNRTMAYQLLRADTKFDKNNYGFVSAAAYPLHFSVSIHAGKLSDSGHFTSNRPNGLSFATSYTFLSGVAASQEAEQLTTQPHC